MITIIIRLVATFAPHPWNIIGVAAAVALWMGLIVAWWLRRRPEKDPDFGGTVPPITGKEMK